MKKVLFLDRDDTIIKQPPGSNWRVNSLEKLEFVPKVITTLHRIVNEFDYELVMVTNQDGLGTEVFPEATFSPAHNKMLTILANEGIHFADVCIDRTFAHENMPTRKPGVGMLGKYLTGDYDLKNSYVVGDSMADMLLAKNLGAQAICFAEGDYPDAVLTTTDWERVYRFLKFPDRIAAVSRRTNETSIAVSVNLDGAGKSAIATGLGFFDHMLEQLAKHSECDLKIQVQGDLDVDEHHTIEDTALALGEAFLKALGDKIGIERYGFLLPMDDALAQVALDFSGRNWLVWEVTFTREFIGDVPTEMFSHFFKSFSDSAKCNLHVKADGQNEHHKIEAIFKAVGKSIKQAVRRTGSRQLPSTKGVL